MKKELVLKNKEEKYNKVYIRKLKINDIEEILVFQTEILNGIKEEHIYCETQRVEFEQYFNNKDTLLGIYTEDNELIAMGVYARYGESEDNYGFDLGIRGKELLEVGQIDSVAVVDKFRGNSLQKIICKELEMVSKEEGKNIICTTISPNNPYSIRTFEALGYEIIKEKEKYGGMRRYILMKKLEYN